MLSNELQWNQGWLHRGFRALRKASGGFRGILEGLPGVLGVYKGFQMRISSEMFQGVVGCFRELRGFRMSYTEFQEVLEALP